MPCMSPTTTPALPIQQAAATTTGRASSTAHALYLRCLTWAFTLFSSLRIVAYVPTIVAICSSGDSSQHSLWTWGSFMMSNLTMAGWLYEHSQQRLNRAIVVNLGNSAMCLAIVLLIVWFRR